ncbi:gtpase slip-gc [Fusarium langsethiae]|uniref:Gtpase slip-gc n=1 Tax=Fusarium langsethiae TaxID=179993 RepID=A0A0M9EYF5_FUSLA|nr:gtpase slip-gc [Fusarium langsethiae]GKT97975.1 unnamed protein product [Fusarium langsethiae]GKU10948.1 unnamed protein product [Fusarium langsethiae]
MEVAALLAPVKRERSPSSEHTLEAPRAKRQADEQTGVTRTPVKFPWRECQELDDVQRLKIKEKAVKQAKENCNKIRALLVPALAAVDEDPDSKNAVIIGRKIIQQWLDQDDTTQQALKNHQVLVGVEGPTGAGKSSFLGSLLRIPELLPMGQDNDTPGHEFRAEITFRPKVEVENDLESLLKELNRYKDLITNKFHEEDDDAQDKADAITESRNKIEYELPKIKAVWGIEKDYLEQAVASCPEFRTYADVAQGILRKNNHVLKLLDSGRVETHYSTAKKLAGIIKPYLDSSVMSVGSHVKFALWPLVKEVHIYAKSEILKSGITLVDLPGCGDATASRSEVAQKVSSDLDVRIIVTPIIRATDEKQGQALMQSGFDEAQMRIRGKLDGNGFGVVVSKMDGINVDSYIDGCDELLNDEQVAQERDRLTYLKEESQRLRPKYTTLRNNKKTAETRKKAAQDKYNTALENQRRKPSAIPGQDAERLMKIQAVVDQHNEAYADADRKLDEYETHCRKVDDELVYLKDWLAHRASQTRNKRVMKRMRENFAIRQRGFGEASTTKKTQNEEDQRFTGIPAVEQWLHRATLNKREKHLDEILDGYQSQLAMMRIYSQTSGKHGDFDFTRDEVEQAVARTHSIFVEKLSATLKGAAMEIENLDPLEHRDRAIRKFVAEANNIAFRWAYKFPDDKQSTLKISFVKRL